MYTKDDLARDRMAHNNLGAIFDALEANRKRGRGHGGKRV